MTLDNAKLVVEIIKKIDLIDLRVSKLETDAEANAYDHYVEIFGKNGLVGILKEEKGELKKELESL